GFKVMGKLTMKGKTNPVVMTVKKTGEGKGPQGKFRTGFEATMTVDRIAFGVDTYPGALSNNVELIISVEGIKQ
ncbi:MAG: YceI family protein, partial [Myxococcota bacterium]